jgi:hypothetical protein
MDTNNFPGTDLLQQQFSTAIGKRFTKNVKQKSIDSTTKDIVYGTMVISLIFPIMMAVFLVLTLQDIDYGESRESCTAPFFTNPGQVTTSNIPSSSSGNGNPIVNVGTAFVTRAKLTQNRSVPLNPYPCIKQN